jgi:hypothetical protein
MRAGTWQAAITGFIIAANGAALRNGEAKRWRRSRWTIWKNIYPIFTASFLMISRITLKTMGYSIR